jgi:hypothetical protein
MSKLFDLQASIVLVAGALCTLQGLREFLNQQRNKQPMVATLALVNVAIGILLIYIYFAVFFKDSFRNYN